MVGITFVAPPPGRKRDAAVALENGRILPGAGGEAPLSPAVATVTHVRQPESLTYPGFCLAPVVWVAV